MRHEPGCREPSSADPRCGRARQAPTASDRPPSRSGSTGRRMTPTPTRGGRWATRRRPCSGPSRPGPGPSWWSSSPPAQRGRPAGRDAGVRRRVRHLARAADRTRRVLRPWRVERIGAVLSLSETTYGCRSPRSVGQTVRRTSSRSIARTSTPGPRCRRPRSASGIRPGSSSMTGRWSPVRQTEMTADDDVRGQLRRPHRAAGRRVARHTGPRHTASPARGILSRQAPPTWPRHGSFGERLAHSAQAAGSTAIRDLLEGSA